MSSKNNSTLSPVSSQPVPYSVVHETFVSLVLLAGKRHAGAGYLRRLTEALTPVDDASKLARLEALAAELEGAK